MFADLILKVGHTFFIGMLAIEDPVWLFANYKITHIQIFGCVQAHLIRDLHLLITDTFTTNIYLSWCKSRILHRGYCALMAFLLTSKDNWRFPFL